MVVARTRMGTRVERQIVPLRDTFAAICSTRAASWFGSTVAPSDIRRIALPLAAAVDFTLTFNVIAGHRRRPDLRPRSRAASNAALMLVSRGTFELILASLAVAAGLDGRIAAFAALYVLVLSILSLAPVGQLPCSRGGSHSGSSHREALCRAGGGGDVLR